MFTGCDKKDDSLAKKAGEVLGKQVTDFTKGVGEGIDKKMAVHIVLTPHLQAIGLTNTIGKYLGIGSTNGIAIYFIASQNVSNTLVARALDDKGVEIGRAKKTTRFAKGRCDIRHIQF